MWRIAVDVGGTFTDVVITNEAGDVYVVKVPSTPTDPAEGVMRGIDRAAHRLGVPVPNFLHNCTLFVHGSTVATNTLVEHKGAKVGLLTTYGFRDSLEIRRGMRDNPWDQRPPSPPVLVPRYLRLAVKGRIDAEGLEVEPFAPTDVDAAVRIFAEEGVESVAICFINAYLNGHHERACADRLKVSWGREWIAVSSDIAPSMGEYERTSTTVINAYIAPRTVTYLRTLHARLRNLGFRHSMLLIQNNGGAVSIEQVANKPVALLLSGPAAGVGALEFYSRAIGTDNLISMEIGGTSCDVILMSEGSVAVTDQLKVSGYHLSLSSVDIHTIGAGGGTIAGVDSAGMLFVGPRGAGAQPGPAAYGFGGKEPTVTDALLVLGRLRPGPYADGSVALNADLAREAIERVIASPLGISVDEAAAGVVRLLEQNLLHAVQRISIERGYDPRQFVLVAGGGAGPMHAATIGWLLGCRKVYVPRLSGAFCALGMLHSNVRHDHVRAYLQRLDEAALAAVDDAFRDLEERATRGLQEAGFDAASMKLTREMDLRYVGQQWDVRVRLEADTALRAKWIRKAFETEYDRLFGHYQPDGIIETANVRVIAIGLIPPLRPSSSAPAADTPRPAERRAVYLDAEHGRAEIDVYRGSELHRRHRLPGPLLIEEQTTTVLVGPRDIVEVDEADNFVIEVGVRA